MPEPAVQPQTINRLFFALWPPDPVRDACAAAARELSMRMQPGGRVIPAARYHMTLLFLGSTVAPEKEAAARQAASLVRASPFVLRLDHAGSFRNRQIPWWLGAHDTPPELVQLHERLREALLRAEVVPDRTKLVPHLTFLRDARRPLPPTAIVAVAWPVDAFVLVRSRLDRNPVEYEVIGRWPLRGGAVPGPDQLALPL
jgi:RNA 2',3'-cyclic 3'-phosphodiesterase